MKLLALVIFGLLTSCAHYSKASSDEVVAKRAMYDFNCNLNEITVNSIGNEVFEAKGCKQSQKYKLQCSVGPCQAIKKN